jgi:hypothetical protein
MTVSIIDRQAAEFYVCDCGNDTGGAGFAAVAPGSFEFYLDADGSPDGPPVGSDWAGHYRCLACNAVHFVVSSDNCSFVTSVMEDFDQMRRMGICNMLDRGCVREYADRMNMHGLASVAGDKRGYASLLLDYRRVVGDA